jgi:hypothetical protein
MMEDFFMGKYKFLLFFFFYLFAGYGICGIGPGDSVSTQLSYIGQDTLVENQILYNGKVWRNLYYKVREDQFLFSKDFLTGSVTIIGKTFNNIALRFDIYNDEIMTPTNLGFILQLNKEMVDSFSLAFQNRTYHFTRIAEDTLRTFKGYLNVLYHGKTKLYVKFKKEISQLSVDGKYDEFYQTHRIFFEKDSIIHLVSGKRDFLNLMGENKSQIRSFVKKNRLPFSIKYPESFLPVMEYYDSMSLQQY